MKKAILLFITILTLASCKKFTEQANKQFGDQHFKTAIALIELHKVRNGSYPDKMTDLEYLGDWDGAVYSTVEYKKLTDGYELNLTRGWAGKPESLNYPDGFWDGLGLKKSNMKK